MTRKRVPSVALLCGPPKACTCPVVAWVCVCREGNVKRGCAAFSATPGDLTRCSTCDWFDWQHPVPEAVQS